MSSAEWMDMMGKTLATIGAAWLCVLLALVLFDYVQNAINGLANVLFAGWGSLDIAFRSLPGIALVVIGAPTIPALSVISRPPTRSTARIEKQHYPSHLPPIERSP